MKNAKKSLTNVDVTSFINYFKESHSQQCLIAPAIAFHSNFCFISLF